MFKNKYLHRKSRNTRRIKDWDGKKYNRGKNLDLFSDELPKHEPIRRKSNLNNLDTTPLCEFLKSNIDQDWDDIYSEIVAKTKPKFRYSIDSRLFWYINIPIYDENFIPRNQRGRILENMFFIDLNNKLVKKTKEEVLKDSKKFLRKEKLKKLLETNY